MSVHGTSVQGLVNIIWRKYVHMYAPYIRIYINSHMSVDINNFGFIKRFNGVDVQYTEEHIKIHDTTVINKILEGHKSWMNLQHCHTILIPMKLELFFNHDWESAIPPTTDRQNYQIQRNHKLNYFQAIVELTYAMVTYRPELLFPVTTLSHYSSNSATKHYEVVKQIFYYNNRCSIKHTCFGRYSLRIF